MNVRGLGSDVGQYNAESAYQSEPFAPFDKASALPSVPLSNIILPDNSLALTRNYDVPIRQNNGI